MNVTQLHLLNFRNYKDLSITFPVEGAIFEGLNGAGKTNLLESIHLLCTGRSQRGAPRTSMIRFDEPHAYVEGVFQSEKQPRGESVSLGFGRDKKFLLNRNGVQSTSFSEWFSGRVVVSFGADDLQLVYGSPEGRRKFIDLLASQIDSEYLETLLTYRRNLRNRNQLLTQNADEIQLSIYEEKMVESGSYLFLKRREIVEFLSGHLTDFYHEISGGRENGKIKYNSNIRCPNSSITEWKNVFYTMLDERRKKDCILGFTTAGPHRDDIVLFLNEKPAKTYGSQGQCRSLALSLKLGSILCIERYRDDSMIFLIDDAVSELDTQRTSRVYPLLEDKGQVFIATPELNVSLRGSVVRCVISEGHVKI